MREGNGYSIKLTLIATKTKKMLKIHTLNIIPIAIKATLRSLPTALEIIFILHK